LTQRLAAALSADRSPIGPTTRQLVTHDASMAAVKSGLNEAGTPGYQQVTDIPSRYICFEALFCGGNPAKVALPLGAGESVA
jgi:hypothetical protein